MGFGRKKARLVVTPSVSFFLASTVARDRLANIDQNYKIYACLLRSSFYHVQWCLLSLVSTILSVYMQT